MRIKFDDGEHANTVPGELLQNNVPDLGDTIEWAGKPASEDDLLPGRYRVSGVDWRIDSTVLVTVHLDPL